MKTPGVNRGILIFVLFLFAKKARQILLDLHFFFFFSVEF